MLAFITPSTSKLDCSKSTLTYFAMVVLKINMDVILHEEYHIE